jgi:hypothetical protein
MHQMHCRNIRRRDLGVGMHELLGRHVRQHHRCHGMFSVCDRQVLGDAGIVGLHELLYRHVLRDGMFEYMRVGMHEMSCRHVRPGDGHHGVRVVYGWDVFGDDWTVGVHELCCGNVSIDDERHCLCTMCCGNVRGGYREFCMQKL